LQNTPSANGREEIESYSVNLHPDGGLFVGDLISLEIIAPPEENVEGLSAEIQVDPPGGETLGPEAFAGFGIANRSQATFTWAWDTSGLPAGDHQLSITILPEGPTWTETVTLSPQSDAPPPEPAARWETTRSDCCTIHYITGTAAERDLPVLLDEADKQADLATDRLGVEFNEPITITLIPRVLGHGGFASNEISISYLDRNYAGSRFSQVLQHEMIHILDARLGGDLRPTMLVEGLAVYLSGGHFKPEPLLPRAAGLLELAPSSPRLETNWYIPLASLADRFYPSQHEIGYLEAGALIETMVDTWGWEAFDRFYRDIHPHPSQSQVEAIDQALQAHFDISLETLEAKFREKLDRQDPEPALVEDVRLTVFFYDTVRRYQQLLDPSAYFQVAWLLDQKKMRQQDIVADYLRHPSEPQNVALETLLVAANEHLLAGNFSETEKILLAVQEELDEIELSAREREAQ
jgi:hypothetical protein